MSRGESQCGVSLPSDSLFSESLTSESLFSESLTSESLTSEFLGSEFPPSEFQSNNRIQPPLNQTPLRLPPRYDLERVLRDMGGTSHWAANLLGANRLGQIWSDTGVIWGLQVQSRKKICKGPLGPGSGCRKRGV